MRIGGGKKVNIWDHQIPIMWTLSPMYHKTLQMLQDFCKNFSPLIYFLLSQHILRLLSHIKHNPAHTNTLHITPPWHQAVMFALGRSRYTHDEWEKMKNEKSWWKLWYKWEKLWKSFRLRLKWQTSASHSRERDIEVYFKMTSLRRWKLSDGENSQHANGWLWLIP